MKKFAALILIFITGCSSQSDGPTPPQLPPADTTAPVATLAPLAENQTSLLFTLEGEAVDDLGSVSSIQLWVQTPDDPPEAWTTVGPYPSFPISYTASGPGLHSFKAIASDDAGNIQDSDQATVQSTIVPEPIIITDVKGEDFDITNAVLRYNLHLFGWDHGLGRNTIRPITDPPFFAPGDQHYPEPFRLIDIMAVNFGGQQRAYAIGDLNNREAVNDLVAGVHLAATY